MTEMVDAESGEIEVGFPVATPFAGDGEVVGRAEPATLVATTLHHGPYDEEGPAYQTVDAWVQDRHVGGDADHPHDGHHAEEDPGRGPGEIEARRPSRTGQDP